MASKEEVLIAARAAIARGTWTCTRTVWGYNLLCKGETQSDTFQVALVVAGGKPTYSAVLVNDAKVSNKYAVEVLSIR